MTKDIFDKVYGCIIGGAIGDAMGAPVEMWYYKDIKEKYGKIDRFMPHQNNVAGMVTDDSAYRHYICLAIIEKGGRITPDDMAKVWIEKLSVNRLWTNERIIKLKLMEGMNPWDSGKGCIPAGCACMAISPIGIINAGNPSQAYQDGFNIAFINQDNVDRDAAATLAAAVSAAFVPEATVESVINSMFDYSTDIVRRALDFTMDLALSSSNVDEFAEKYYNKMLDWTWPRLHFNKDKFISGSSLELLPVVPAILHLCKGDVNQCIIEGASFGRDCDTISNIAGGISGILQGASAIRKDWIEACEKANEPLFEEVESNRELNFHSVAFRLVEAMKSEAGKMREKLEVYTRIIH